MRPRTLSLRARFQLMLVFGAVLPLAVIGAWLVRSSSRAAETLLASQLQEALDDEARRIEARWSVVKGDLLLLADNDVAWRVLMESSSPASRERFLQNAFETGHPGILGVSWLAPDGTRRYSLPDVATGVASRAELDPAAELRGTSRGSPSSPPRTRSGLSLTFPIRDDQERVVGHLQAELALSALLPSELASTTPEAMLWVVDARTGAPLLGSQTAGDAPATGRFERGERTWIGVRRALGEPPLELWLAAPVDPIIAPFARAARTGGAALILVSLLVVLVTSYLTTRIMRSVSDATQAAEAIATGDLEHRIPVSRDDEVGRLGRAINAMAENLSGTLDALARQRSLGVLGEFATSLAHEVRNAHTAIGVDLQRALEQTADQPEVHVLLSRSLRRVRSVDRVVHGALAVARSGRVESRVVDLRNVLESAARATQPWFAEQQSTLEMDLPAEPVAMLGDSSALESLFVNLLRNAAQSLEPGGRAWLALSRRNGKGIEVLVRDEGQGMSPGDLAGALTPFVTTRPGGTGLGLPIARQVAYAHGGDLEITSEPGVGTQVRVTLGLEDPSRLARA
jgi:signal transduction histidine kinase